MRTLGAATAKKKALRAPGYAALVGTVAQKKSRGITYNGQRRGTKQAFGSTTDQAAAFTPQTGSGVGNRGAGFTAIAAPGQGNRGGIQNPPPGPVDPFSVSSYNPASGNPDPRDASYFANLAKLQATAHQDYAGGQLEQTNADVNTQQQLGSMASDRQTNIRNLAESMIGSGLLRSGYHDRGQTEATGKYLEAVSGVQSNKAQEDASRKARMNAILSNLGIDEQGLYADAAGRYALSQQDLADKSTPTGPVAYPTEPSTSAPRKPPKKRKRK